MEPYSIPEVGENLQVAFSSVESERVVLVVPLLNSPLGDRLDLTGGVESEGLSEHETETFVMLALETVPEPFVTVHVCPEGWVRTATA